MALEEGVTFNQIIELFEKFSLTTTRESMNKIEAMTDKQRKLLYFKLSEFVSSEETDTCINIQSIKINVCKEKEQEEKHLTILNDHNLFENIVQEFNKEIEGEEQSKKAIFLSLCSVWVEDVEVPLNTLVSSESSTGKSFICKKITKIFPEELVEYRSKITPEAFSYWHSNEKDWTWNGKICYLEDISQALLDSPTFKVMCSEGSIATIVKNQKAIDLHIEGKPVILVTTARTNPNTEVITRFQIISLDESKEQTKNIVFRIAKNNETINKEKYDPKIINALSFLKRKKVFVPFSQKIAEALNKGYNFDDLRLRRDFSRLLTLIKSSAVLYQFQRKKVDVGMIEATEQDYNIAREVINYIKTQTLKGLTHRLKKAYDCCKELKKFTAKEIHASFPFCSYKMWYIYLNDLLERGMLKTILEEVEGVKQKVTYFLINETSSLELPEFNELLNNITNVSTVTKVTKDTIVTKDNEKSKNNSNNCNNCQVKVPKEQEEFSFTPI